LKRPGKKFPKEREHGKNLIKTDANIQAYPFSPQPKAVYRRGLYRFFGGLQGQDDCKNAVNLTPFTAFGGLDPAIHCRSYHG